MVMGFLLAVYGLYRWMESGGWRWTALAGLAGGLAVLTKIVIVYPLAGGAVAAVLTRQGLRKALRDPQVWAMALLMAAPSAVFYLFDNAERASEYFTAWTLALLRLLASPEFYVRWMSFLHGLVSLTIVFLALAGALISAPRHRALLAGLWIGYFLYGLSLPYQMYTHSYYHLQLIPILALGLAPLAQLVLGQAARQGRPVQLLFAGLALVAAAYPAWVGRSILVAEDFRAEPAYWQEVGAALPADGEIVALTQDYGYRLMYYGWRKVDLWPITGEQDLAELRGSAEDFEARFRRYTQGQAYFVVTAFGQYNKQPDLRQRLEKDYPLIAQGDGYLVFDLRAPLTPQP
jgi:4-amino-4-deoxy-L-arabinose transferase-like glycosyltransferase